MPIQIHKEIEIRGKRLTLFEHMRRVNDDPPCEGFPLFDFVVVQKDLTVCTPHFYGWDIDEEKGFKTFLEAKEFYDTLLSKLKNPEDTK